MVETSRDVFTTPVVRAALPGLVADMADDPALNARVMQRFASVFAAVHDRVRRAIEQADVRLEADADRLIEVIGDATMLRLLLRPREDLDDEWVAQTTAIIVHGVA